jgi:hypothetical protein
VIIFARTRHTYDSYTDFWTLVSLSEFPTCYVDEIDLRARNVYVTTMQNGEWQEMIQKQKGRRNAHLILWNLERPAGWAGTVGKYNERVWSMIHNRWFDEHWVSDRRLAEETETRFVVLGSHPRLGEPSKIEDRAFDFVHMSLLTNRRQSIFKKFNPSFVGQNCWPPKRHGVLRSSKFAFNVHQDNHPYQEPLRFALFAAYGLPILSEDIYDSYPWDASTMIWDKYPHLVGHMHALLDDRNYQKFYDMGMRAHQRMTVQYEFGKVVRQAVYESTGER